MYYSTCLELLGTVFQEWPPCVTWRHPKNWLTHMTEKYMATSKRYARKFFAAFSSTQYRNSFLLTVIHLTLCLHRTCWVPCVRPLRRTSVYRFTPTSNSTTGIRSRSAWGISPTCLESDQSDCSTDWSTSKVNMII